MISEKLQKEREIIVSLFNKVPEYLGNRYPDNFDAPTKAQFCYAVKFGIDMRWQTFQSTSAAIEKPYSRSRENTPGISFPPEKSGRMA